MLTLIKMFGWYEKDIENAKSLGNKDSQIMKSAFEDILLYAKTQNVDLNSGKRESIINISSTMPDSERINSNAQVNIKQQMNDLSQTEQLDLNQHSESSNKSNDPSESRDQTFFTTKSNPNEFLADTKIPYIHPNFFMQRKQNYPLFIHNTLDDEDLKNLGNV